MRCGPVPPGCRALRCSEAHPHPRCIGKNAGARWLRRLHWKSPYSSPAPIQKDGGSIRCQMDVGLLVWVWRGSIGYGSGELLLTSICASGFPGSNAASLQCDRKNTLRNIHIGMHDPFHPLYLCLSPLSKEICRTLILNWNMKQPRGQQVCKTRG